MAIRKVTIKGATLIESLTAMTIIIAVFTIAFSLFNQTITHQNLTNKTKALLKQFEFEQTINKTDEISTIDDPTLQITIDELPYKQNKDIKHYTLHITDKVGKRIREIDYLLYMPEK